MTGIPTDTKDNVTGYEITTPRRRVNRAPRRLPETYKGGWTLVSISIRALPRTNTEEPLLRSGERIK